MKKKLKSGLSLIEILVVMTIFAILGIIISSSVALTILGTKKSEALTRVRENVNYSLTIVERNLRNAGSITDCSDPNTLTYIDQYGQETSFSCQNIGGDDSYIASGSARLTSSAIKIVSCSFTCEYPPDLTQAPMVSINVAAKDLLLSGSQSASISAQTKVYLRN